MNAPALDWPDVEDLMLAYLSPLGTTDSQTPANLQDVLPFITARTFGGSDDGWTQTVSLDVDAFAPTYVAARALARAIRKQLEVPLLVVNGVAFDRISCLVVPFELPYADPNVRRFNATYRVTSRRTRG